MMRRRLCLAAAAAAVVLGAAILSGCGSAADLFASIDRLVFPPPPGGTLDDTFGSGGKVTTEVVAGNYDYAYGVAIQSDGRIVVGGATHGLPGSGDFVVARYTTAGSLDTSFSATGVVTTDVGSSEDAGTCIAIQADGKIVVAGSSSNGSNDDFAVVRYTAAGALDASFNGTGKVTTPIGSGSECANAIAIQSDGKIVVAGFSDNGANHDFALVRYTSAGALDTSFDGDGKVTTAVGSGYDSALALAIQSDGRIVAAGYSNNGIDDDFAVVRYTSSGALDVAFDGDGKVTTPVGAGLDQARAVAIQGDGKIVVAGYSGGPPDVAVVRYTAGGSLDTTFSGDGKQTTDVQGDSDRGMALALQSDGAIVVAGSAYLLSTTTDFAAFRYTSTGLLDSTFGTGGIVTTPIGAATDQGHAVDIQSDGKIVVAGTANNIGGYPKIAVVRYWP